MSNPTDINQASEELKSILGEIPNYIFDYLELSDDIRKEWKYGSRASDFGRHNQFVQQFSKRLEAIIRTEKLKLLDEVREQTTIFKIKAHDKKGQPHLYEAGRGVPTEVLTKLEAEL